jgi:hypothetical protein
VPISEWFADFAQIQFWKTVEGKSTMREHSIIYQEAGPCWRHVDAASPGSAQLMSVTAQTAAAATAGGVRSVGGRATSGRRGKRDVNSAHVYNLWPYTNITAHIVALNAKYEGPASHSITFMTKEGGQFQTKISTVVAVITAKLLSFRQLECKTHDFAY